MAEPFEKGKCMNFLGVIRDILAASGIVIAAGKMGNEAFLLDTTGVASRQRYNPEQLREIVGTRRRIVVTFRESGVKLQLAITRQGADCFHGLVASMNDCDIPNDLLPVIITRGPNDCIVVKLNPKTNL